MIKLTRLRKNRIMIKKAIDLVIDNYQKKALSKEYLKLNLDKNTYDKFNKELKTISNLSTDVKVYRQLAVKCIDTETFLIEII